MKHRGIVVAHIGLLALFLSGCSSGESNSGKSNDVQPPGATAPFPSDDSESSPATDEYVAASADGPAQNVPEPKFTTEVQELTEEDAEAALRHWFALMDYMTLTGDSKQFLEKSHDDCEDCTKMSEGWANLYESQHWVVAEPMEIEITDSHVHHEDNTVEFMVKAVERPVVLYDPNGKEIENPQNEQTLTGAWNIWMDLDPSFRRWEAFINGVEYSEE